MVTRKRSRVAKKETGRVEESTLGTVILAVDELRKVTSCSGIITEGKL